MTDPNHPNSDQTAWTAPHEPPAQQPAPGSYPPPGGSYGQPGAGQPPYQGAPVPPPGQYGQPAFGAPGFPPPAPAKRKTGKILAIVGGALVIVIVAAVVIASLVNKHSDKLAREHSFDVPASAGGYVLQKTDTATQVSDSMLSSLKSSDGDGVWNNPKIGVYGKDASGQPEIILLGLNVADSKGLTREMGTHSISDEAKAVLKGAGLSDAKDYDAGKFGGVLKCGSLPADGGESLATCVWLDHSTMGMVLQIKGTADSTAAAAKAIREAGEK